MARARELFSKLTQKYFSLSINLITLKELLKFLRQITEDQNGVVISDITYMAE